MAVGDRITLYFNIVGPDEYNAGTLTVSQRMVGANITFTVPKSNIVKALDTEAQVMYVVAYDTNTDQSPTLTLKILKAPAASS
ncbi:hypothetical protein PHO31112_03305 [Pandoraea horticolens]|uniref:Uncharacterized protein n=1 Tax=Pandoraea horticolens TaxID=2508298 RepID=A0A5E4WHR4_9BURK|nr:hypothetical protein [Pandoraea horticolens]VVE24577.1 hypothetical protein PHO31112_03305 [Pandoraea horticolens]